MLQAWPYLKTVSAFSVPKKNIYWWIVDDYDFERLVLQISNYDHERFHRRLAQNRLVGTTQWFLDHSHFKVWFVGKSNSSLWCSRKSKSVLTCLECNTDVQLFTNWLRQDNDNVGLPWKTSFWDHRLITNRTVVLEAAQYSERRFSTVFFHCEDECRRDLDSYCR